MRVLWFEITIPGRYRNDGAPIAGWQDSLENIVRGCKDIELSIAFDATDITDAKEKDVDGVHYYPLVAHDNIIDKKFRNGCDAWNRANKIIPLAVKLIEQLKPDIIQIFGSEWEFGQVARYTDVPVVLHMQGCIAPYNNALYPPGYSINDEILFAGLNLKRLFWIWKHSNYNKSRAELEKSNFKAVRYYMGRTEWDKQLVELFHSDARYFFCSEALRPSFIENAQIWQPKTNKKIRLITTGCDSHWKGMDTLLKTAHVLKQYGFDFEWLVAGKMGQQKMIERKEHLRFKDNNVKILGFTKADKLTEYLLSSDIYVHTAYIDNSPNSICEAQYLGLPIISTFVGGIPSLFEDRKGGVFLPANASENMAFEIMSLSKDKKRQQQYSIYNMKTARERHAPANILHDLLACYRAIIEDTGRDAVI
uniref:Glycosyl transferase family 1 domain-containing protein n=1 Tax=Prevotella sp. GTC17260 TaxID=3236796 RepID=A0AB33JH21_9BACT